MLKRFANHCIECGICLNSCSLLGELGMTPAEIAEALSSGAVDPALTAAIQRCDLCGRCGQDCLVNLNPADLMKVAREMLIQNGAIDPEEYDVMRVDRDWNFFTIYRDTYAIRYDDLYASEYDTLFFPGCTLSSYAPELTRAAFEWLQGQGLRMGFSEMCCGKPLDSIGLAKDLPCYLAPLKAQFAAAGARRIVTACPNCESHLKATLPGIEVRSIYALMLEAGLAPRGSERLTIHDSCPDRYDGQSGSDIRRLLAGYPQVEMASHGKNTICCGSGGIVSMIDPGLCTERAERRMTEFAESGADTCITGCMACTHRLARTGQPGRVRHCLEYVFDQHIDYARIDQNTHAMWEGSQGETNLLRLAQAQSVGCNEDPHEPAD